MPKDNIKCIDITDAIQCSYRSDLRIKGVSNEDEGEGGESGRDYNSEDLPGENEEDYIGSGDDCMKEDISL